MAESGGARVPLDTSTPTCATRASLLAQAARTLDFDRPVALMPLGVLHCILDEDDPHAIVARLLAGVPTRSYLVVAHPATDIAVAQMARSSREYNQTAPVLVMMRSHAEVSRFFTGLEILEPGVVQLHRWRPGTGDPALRQCVAVG